MSKDGLIYLETDKPNNNKICIREVNENIRRVRIGEELTRPLKQLNENCEFKEKYEDAFNIWNNLPLEDRIKLEKERLIRNEKQAKYFSIEKNRIKRIDQNRKLRVKNQKERSTRLHNIRLIVPKKINSNVRRYR